ncbi:MAG: hypothetical protein WBI17_12650 [Clostridiaceae bacterium]
MPTISQMNIPIPASWDEFEEITLDALKLRWESKELNRNGRQGQTQYGVDIFGFNDLYQSVGVQCKRYNIQLTVDIIKSEIAKAENFEPGLTSLYFATTTPRDAKLQKEIRLLSKERVENKQFSIGIFFWDDILQDISSNIEIFGKHYPQLFKESNQKLRTNIFGLLDLVFYGINMKFYMGLIFGIFGTDPLEMQAICELISNGSSFVKNNKSRDELVNYINDFKDYTLNGQELKYGWKPANDMATQIENIILTMNSGLAEEELIVYEIGFLLSNWDRNITNNIEIRNASIDKFFRLLDKLELRKEYVNKIRKLVSDLNDLENLSNVQIPSKIYNTVRNGLIENCIFKH